MNWEAIGAIGETLGGIGVIVTLIYLALQIRQNTKVSRAASAQQMTDKWVTINLQVSLMPGGMTLSGISSLSDLPEEHAGQVLALWRAIFHQWSNNHYQYTQGVLDPVLFVPTGREIATYAATQGIGQFIREAWGTARYIYNDNFAEYMDKLLEQNPVSTTVDGDV
jgi:hypothetical protein